MKRHTRGTTLKCFSLVMALCVSASQRGHAQPKLTVEPGVQLQWPTATNKTYRPQWTPNPPGAWNDLTAAAPGNGATNTYFDPFLGGTRNYQVLEVVPGVPAAAALPTNGGFETGSGATATSWQVTQAAGGPVYAVRTNSNPHGGANNFEVRLASTGGGPVVEFGQLSVPVTGGTTYPFTFYADAVTGSAGYNAQWRILWNAGGDTGFKNFTPGNNVYAFISNSVMAPASATAANIYFHFAGAAITNQSANILVDDVVLGAAGSGPGSPGQTNALPVTSQPVFKISWPSTAGVQYQPQSVVALSGDIWTSNYPAVTGDGGTKSVLLPMTNNSGFLRLVIPATPVLPPANLHTVASGSTNAIGLAWTASGTAGVTGYRVYYGTNSGSLTNFIDVGNVTSANIPGLTPGVTYYLAVVALTTSGQSQQADATIAAQTAAATGLVNLFSAATVLEPDTTVDTPTARITYIGDRARDRHAREADFGIYDHYLSWYWEQRVADIQIIDYVAKGGSNIVFNYTTQGELNPAEFRTFFRGINTVAEYHNNQIGTLISTNASVMVPGETDFNYRATITANAQYNRPLQVGDRVEIEISQFLLAPRHGRNNYYGTVLLYIVGQGIVPWGSGQDLGFGTGVSNSVNIALDSHPLPTNAWLGGTTTLPYQYSNEPTNHFKQTTGNISPTNAHLFMLGRRLHHTDFGTGAHSEPNNPVFTEHVGQLGNKFVNRSCMACHINNGRALPPAIGASMFQSVVKVGSNASGSPHATLGAVLQGQSVNGPVEGSATISSYTTNSGQYGDATSYSLQKPNYAFQGTVPTYFSIRVAPQLVGLGLLEAVSEDTIAALADPNDIDADGISGRMQVVTDPETTQQRLGRFNYKAGKARLSHQVAGALNNDMGVPTTVFPVLDGDSTNSPAEVSAVELDQMTRYVALLGVSARRDLTNTQALQGEQLFATANCIKCHTPTLTTSPYHPNPELRNQTIHPYTDLLLHDMGSGLADNMGEEAAAGSEWRTAPLWNIGLTAATSGGEAYLHDGRARTLEEAILWHGGEAEAAKEAFRTMSATNRAAVVKFLKSL